jgi:hypothetical protein
MRFPADDRFQAGKLADLLDDLPRVALPGPHVFSVRRPCAVHHHGGDRPHPILPFAARLAPDQPCE